MKKKARLALLAALACAALLLLPGHRLRVTQLTLDTPGLTAPLRAVQLSDLHNSRFGEGNSRLLELVRAQAPDLILVTGDMVNGWQEDTGIAVQLMADLCGIAPVYASYGNHEKQHEETFGGSLQAAYEAVGATVLEGAYRDIDVNGQAIRIGGIYGYCLPESALATGEASRAECAFLRAFQQTDALTILLCHMPVSWLEYGSLQAWDVDCVFSGHAHGGQIVLPGLGGLYAPDQGWLPGRVYGLFCREGRRLVVSSGLGGGFPVPRINNDPEVIVVDFVPAQQ